MKVVPSWPHLWATEDGQIIGVLGKPLSPRAGRGGYLRINTTVDGRHVTLLVHRLICETFHGPCPDGHEVAHTDGSRANNRADNLRWDTRSGNMADKVAHGTLYEGSRHVRAKLSTDQVQEIRDRYAAGETQTGLATAFGVGQSHIGRICRLESRKRL